MKTSNKLLLTAFVILFGSLAAYNMALKAEYNKGTYKDPYRDFVTLPIRNFDQIEINPATEMNVKIISGQFNVRVHKTATEFIKFKQNGKRLKIDLVYPDEQDYINNRELVVISCPNVADLSTSGVYTLNGKKIVNIKEYTPSSVTVVGFSQDSLAVQLDKASSVALKETKLKKLRVVVGVSTGSDARLFLDKTNTIQEANLDIRNKSELILDNLTIPKLNYHFADSAKATFSGSSLGILVP